MSVRSIRRGFRSIALPVAGVLLLTGCDDNATEPDPAATGTVVIQWDAVAGAEVLALGSGHAGYMNAAGNVYWTTNLEYIVSDFKLEVEAAARAEGDFEAGADAIHYRTHSDDATRTLTLTDVPAGDYSHLHFRFGINDALNDAGMFPAMDTAGMAWPAMQGGGYHYMRHEGNFVTTAVDTVGFTTHTGPTMSTDYSFEVELELHAGAERHGFAVPAGGTVTITLAMDVNEWYTTPNSYDFNDYGLIMGNAAAQTTLQGNGPGVWSVQGVATE
ncbi:MAG: hypothetical protein DHS20C21_18030 [Gemmatimonadota bacterium]|nr:MAG: hypothetical protein DHS20C21_18030 [Gemmatimonadota bacterium]